MRKLSATFTAVCALTAATAAMAQDSAVITTDLNMRAGPSSRFPVITTLPADVRVDIYGCVDGYEWCDVSWRGNRGWIFADYLSYRYEGRFVPVVDYGPRIGIDIVGFSVDSYWGSHYRDRPWYDNRSRWITIWDRDGRDYRTRDRRVDRDRDWDRNDRDRDDRDADRNRDRDRDRADRDRDRDGDRDRDRADRDRQRDRDRDRTDQERDGDGYGYRSDGEQEDRDRSSRDKSRGDRDRGDQNSNSGSENRQDGQRSENSPGEGAQNRPSGGGAPAGQGGPPAAQSGGGNVPDTP
jgi:uncharacterized protein YraI